MERELPGWAKWLGAWLGRASRWHLRRHRWTRITLLRSLAFAVVAYAICWLCAYTRLADAEIREKARLAATMLTLNDRGETAAAAFDRLGPTLDSLGIDFRPYVGRADCGCRRTAAEPTTQAIGDSMFGIADHIATLKDDDPAFVPEVLRFAAYAQRLRQDRPDDVPLIAGYVTGEAEYKGCDPGAPTGGTGAFRESARAFLRYADAFASAAPWDASAPVPPVPPATTRPAAWPAAMAAEARMRAKAIQSVPTSVLAAPWELLRFMAPSFAEAQANIPSAFLFLLLAYHFVAGLRFASVGRGGLFARRPRPDRPLRARIAVAGVLLCVIVLLTEGRDTPIELLRLPIMVASVVVAAALFESLGAMRRAPLSNDLLRMELADRKRRLVPFAIGAACIVAAAAWAIRFSVFGLMLRLNPGDFVRGPAQAGLSAYLIVLLGVVAWRLLFERPATADAPAPDLDPSEAARISWAQELAKALPLLLPPLAAAVLDRFTGA